MQFHEIIIEPHYFPCLEYFQVLSRTNQVLLEVYQNFEKQNYNNRCHVLSSAGIQHLSIPLHKSSKLAYKEIRIDNSQKWTLNHERAIRSCYGKSPFFEHYASEIIGLVHKKHTHLWELNLTILSNCLEILGFNIKLSCTTKFDKIVPNRVTDLRSVIHPKKPSILENHFPGIQYTQVFGNKFVQNLSIIDLLFCEGPNAGYILGGESD